jgi:hypothetical protein
MRNGYELWVGEAARRIAAGHFAVLLEKLKKKKNKTGYRISGIVTGTSEKQGCQPLQRHALMNSMNTETYRYKLYLPFSCHKPNTT